MRLGSGAYFLKLIYAAPINLACSKSSFASSYICRLTSLGGVYPSGCSVDQWGNGVSVGRQVQLMGHVRRDIFQIFVAVTVMSSGCLAV